MDPADLFDESRFVPTPADLLPPADLDELFDQSFDNPGLRVELQRRLLGGTLWVVLHHDPDPAEDLGGRQELAPLHLAGGELPLFTSEAKLLEQKPPEGTSYGELMVRDFLENNDNVTLVLNPWSERYMNLPPAQVQELLNGTLFGQGITDNRDETKAPRSEATIDPNKQWPEGMARALQTVFSQVPRVQAAYMIYLLADANDSACYHIRLEMEGRETELLGKLLRPVMDEYLQIGEGFELTGFMPDDEVSAYMRQQGAFYERT